MLRDVKTWLKMQFCKFLQHCKGHLTSVKISHVTFKM